MFAFGNDIGMKALLLHVVADRLSYWLTDRINSLSVISVFQKVTFLANVSSTSMLSLARESVFLSLVEQTSEEVIAYS
jgi:hypothetical protein